MKIIHTADIHLDSKLTANLSASKRATRKNEQLTSFKKLVEYAHSEKVEAILIAGDFFDEKTITLKTKQFVFNLIEKYSHIKFFYLCGNHDENSSVIGNEEVPMNLIVFSEAISGYELEENVVISGLELSKKNFLTFYDDINLDPNKINILVLHGQAENRIDKTNYEIINVKALANKNINYLALGHYHSYQSFKLDDKGVYVYSGCLEGRGFDETGPKGFVLLEIENNKLTHTFVPFAKRELYEINVDISNLVTHLEIEQKIRDSVKIIDEKNLLRINLVGNISLSTQIDVNYYQTAFEHEFFFVRVENKTKLQINVDDFKNDISLKGEFIRLVLNSKEKPEVKDKIILTGINALLGEEVDL